MQTMKCKDMRTHLESVLSQNSNLNSMWCSQHLRFWLEMCQSVALVSPAECSKAHVQIPPLDITPMFPVLVNSLMILCGNLGSPQTYPVLSMPAWPVGAVLLFLSCRHLTDHTLLCSWFKLPLPSYLTGPTHFSISRCPSQHLPHRIHPHRQALLTSSPIMKALLYTRYHGFSLSPVQTQPPQALIPQVHPQLLITLCPSLVSINALSYGWISLIFEVPSKNTILSEIVIGY